MVTPSIPVTATPSIAVTVSSPTDKVPTRTQSQPKVTIALTHTNDPENEVPILDSSSTDFIINQPKRLKIETEKRKRQVRPTRRHPILTRAATAPGQRKVSDYFLTESEWSQYVRDFLQGAGFDTDDSNLLPDLARNRSPPCIVIDSSSSDDVIVVCAETKNSGPHHISSPVRGMTRLIWITHHCRQLILHHQLTRISL